MPKDRRRRRGCRGAGGRYGPVLALRFPNGSHCLKECAARAPIKLTCADRSYKMNVSYTGSTFDRHHAASKFARNL